MPSSRLQAALLLALAAPASAEQLSHDDDRSRPRHWTFETRWLDADDQRHEVRYSLPAEGVREDLEAPLRFKPRRALGYAARQVNAWGKGVQGVKVEANVVDGELQIQASGDAAKLRDTLREAADVRDAALEDYLELHGYTYYRRNVIIPDHARHIAEYADELAPLVRALGGPTEDPRVFAELALSFVQSIPYEQRGRISDRYRRPLSVLGRNQGDCDSKTVLYLALMREAYPELPLAMVYIRGHAFGALGLEPERGDARFRRQGQRWVGVEPVGPSLQGVGGLDGRSRRWLRARRARLIAVEG